MPVCDSAKQDFPVCAGSFSFTSAQRLLAGCSGFARGACQAKLAAAVAAMSCVAAVYGQTIQNPLNPSLTGAFSELEGQQVATRFQLTQASLLQTLAWYGRYESVFPVPSPVLFCVRIFSDAGGLPAASPLRELCVPATAQDSGIMGWSLYSVALGIPVNAGTYWLSILESDVRTPLAHPYEWLWAHGMNLGIEVWREATTAWQAGNPVTHAFTLFTTPTGSTSRGDFNGDGSPDVIWQNDTSRQATVHFYGGAQGAAFQGWSWLYSSGVPGWRLVTAADFDGNGVPDAVWMNDATRQVTVHYFGGAQGAAFQGWNWLNAAGVAGWTVVAAADVDGNGTPDLIWQNDATRQVTVHYYGGTQGAVYQGWNWLNAAGVTGWHVAAAADFDGNGRPDLVWQNDATRQVTVHYYGGAQGAAYQGWNWLDSTGVAGWTVAGANDFDRNGTPDLVWQNDASRQVTVHYFGGTQGAVYQGWNWISAAGAAGWRIVIPR